MPWRTINVQCEEPPEHAKSIHALIYIGHGIYSMNISVLLAGKVID